MTGEVMAGEEMAVLLLNHLLPNLSGQLVKADLCYPLTHLSEPRCYVALAGLIIDQGPLAHGVYFLLSAIDFTLVRARK